MTYFIVLAALYVFTTGALIGLVVWLVRAKADADEKAHAEREQARQTVLALAEQAERERQVLLDRIQRPEVAPVQYAPDPQPGPLFVDQDDDEGQWDVVRTEAQRKAAANGEN